jgi:hypothetical protein
MPSVRLQFALVVGGGPQTPSTPVPLFVQTPEQQSVPVEHESPFWLQNDGDWHCPATQ